MNSDSIITDIRGYSIYSYSGIRSIERTLNVPSVSVSVIVSVSVCVSVSVGITVGVGIGIGIGIGFGISISSINRTNLEASNFSQYVWNHAGFISRPIRSTMAFSPNTEMLMLVYKC